MIGRMSRLKRTSECAQAATASARTHPLIDSQYTPRSAAIYTLRSFVTRPTSTHSTTKILPAWSKQAPCGRDEFAGREMIARQLAGVAPFARGIVAEMLDHLVVLVQQRDARAEIRDHHIAVLEVVEVARHVRAADEIDVLAGEREALNARVAAIGDGQDRASRRACPR